MMLEQELAKMQGEISQIKERNQRVESEKAWETSGMRIGSIAAVTYVVAAALLYFIGVKNFLLAAFVPAVGYYLSTQSLPAVRNWWIRKYLK